MIANTVTDVHSSCTYALCVAAEDTCNAVFVYPKGVAGPMYRRSMVMCRIYLRSRVVVLVSAVMQGSLW